MCIKSLAVVTEGTVAKLYVTQRGNVGDFTFM